ncbi:RagB/SusD family nutrient uptake outer membrane protein [Foetidibacter luteolus]|uniref:RagB/SusD family nutrient uptake outer membrane protein n=1 Tax=Foetidibacter luteolus TaxID=2608880 RepID=UPI00129BDDFD|nr:RagB/SusD family nutrient uptake outer membrane protein [Foetidibacter luteolus]
MTLNKKLVGACLLSVGLFSACTLKEKLNSTLTGDQAQDVLNQSTDVSVLLQAAYTDLNVFQNQDGPFSLEENSSDECLVPTRGSDWDDNGAWRVIHSHNWNADHNQITANFNSLLKAVFDATNVLAFNPSAAQAAEAKFIRAFAMYTVLDLYGQVPYREVGENLLNAPKVFKGEEAADFIIAELESVLSALPDGSPATAGKANKNAARVLLMKLYLNKSSYGDARQNPTFDDADMQKVISLADAVTGYSLAANFFDNYGPDNTTKTTENIFVLKNDVGVGNGNNVRSRWFMTLHYSQPPGGWNGFSTLVDVYNKFEATDKRRKDSIIGSSNIHGVTTGFLRGQQYDEKGTALKDRKGNPLVFLDDVKLQETDPNTLERTGIRVIKYPIHYNASGAGIDNAGNDYVIFRYADVLLMKAEALLRKASPDAASATSLVNQVRTIRDASALATVTLPVLLDERQREFYWDGWRRQDLVRFGVYLQPWALKPTDDPKYLWFPIPNSALAVNPNLTQNPGY